MEDLYLYIVILLAILAIGDLIVGVSNDAVNFLNSAIGSKAISFRNIMILASFGIALGAIFSSGMMEVARKGIFNPSAFNFQEIIFIFMAVMITDILLLDFFNTLGMPTSTTVSIVFELLGAAIVMALIKISGSGGGLDELSNYINTSKATQIVFGILLSVVVAFTIGALVQWISRYMLSFYIEKNSAFKRALFGGISLSALSNFILIKGIKGTEYASYAFSFLGDRTIREFLNNELITVNAINIIIWYLTSYVIIRFTRINLFKLIIGIGTFALALAFAGNDLVNFIGVPIAAFQSYEAWVASGIPAKSYEMSILATKVPTPTLFLLGSGIIMILTLWFSSKAKSVVQTSLDLSNQNETKERFKPNAVSRLLVRLFSWIGEKVMVLIPEKTQKEIDKRFELLPTDTSEDWTDETPSFDMMRASVNLVVAAVLISAATSLKLPLSTTYVTFMVAMGTSLSDKAWGRDSAVYRVAGVLNVIGGWFFTALSAFTVCGAILYLFHIGGPVAIASIFFIVLLIIGKNFMSYRKKNKLSKEETSLLKADSRSFIGVIKEADENITQVAIGTDRSFTLLIEGLSTQNIKKLQKAKDQVKNLEVSIHDLRNNLFFFIRNLEDSSLSASTFYIDSLRHIHDIIEDIGYLVKISFNHVNNNHSKLKLSQIRDLKDISEVIDVLLKGSINAFEDNSLSKLKEVLERRNSILSSLDEKINSQILRTRSQETSPKNTTLYFNILIKSKDLIKHKLDLINLFYVNTIKIKNQL
ncbi:MAG: inorganic phosphate transporter [Flavobacteriaceae bacterium]